MTAISGVEFLIWLLIAASTIAVLAKYLRISYTVAEDYSLACFVCRSCRPFNRTSVRIG